ncbi:MAG: hypothetical protein ACE5HO_12225 [bacterium]
MLDIKKQYIIDESNKKIAVQIDLQTFQKIEEILENYSLVHLMKENEGEDTLDLNQAKVFYQALEKAD